TQLVLEGQSHGVVEPVLRFATEVGLPITLAEIGLAELPRALLGQVAERATAKGETTHHEPFEVQPDMVADALLAADATGRAWQRANGRCTGPIEERDRHRASVSPGAGGAVCSTARQPTSAARETGGTSDRAGTRVPGVSPRGALPVGRPRRPRGLAAADR